MIQSQPHASCKVYTPAPLAKAIVSALADSTEGHWLEPSLGHGVFLEALAGLGVPSSRIYGLDLDVVPHPNDALGVTLRGQDFLTWATETEYRFDAIVGNPPYLSLKMSGEAQRYAVSKIARLMDCKLSMRANLWTAFVWGSLRLLKPRGNLGLVLPASFEYADYAAELRALLPQLFNSVDVFRSKAPLFDQVREGCVVLICKGFGGSSPKMQVQVHSGIDEMIPALGRTVAEGLLTEDQAAPAVGTPKLGDFAEIRIGAVTGDSKYFLLSEKERRSWGLPESSLVPVVTRSRHLRAQIGKEHWHELLQAAQKVWLFSPSDDDLRTPEVARYIQAGKAGKCRDTYKVRTRRPWFRVPLPSRPHAFVSGMSEVGPFLGFSAWDKLLASNTLYGLRFRTFVTENERFALGISLLTTAGRKNVQRVGRRYPDGLIKLEPRDLANLSVQANNRSDAQQQYELCVSLLLANRVADCCMLADHWFSQ